MFRLSVGRLKAPLIAVQPERGEIAPLRIPSLFVNLTQIPVVFLGFKTSSKISWLA